MIAPMDACTLRPRMTRAEAAAALARREGGRLGRLRGHQLRSLAQVFVPYHLFHVRIDDGARHQQSAYAVDAVSATLDPYAFDADADAGTLRALDLQPISGGNRVPALLDADAAWLRLEDTLRRAVFQTGFFRLRDPRLSAARAPIDLHVPYWIGFYEAGGAVRIEAIDAVRGRFEGGKARALFEGWLERATAAPDPTASSGPCPGRLPARTACR